MAGERALGGLRAGAATAEGPPRSGLLPGTHYEPRYKAWELEVYKRINAGHLAQEGEAAEGTIEGPVPPVQGGAVDDAVGMTEKLMGPHEFTVEPRNVHRSGAGDRL